MRDFLFFSYIYIYTEAPVKNSGGARCFRRLFKCWRRVRGLDHHPLPPPFQLLLIFYVFFFKCGRIFLLFCFFQMWTQGGRAWSVRSAGAASSPLWTLRSCHLVQILRNSQNSKLHSGASNSKNTRALTFETQKSVRLYWAKLESCLFVVNREQNTFY
jgi:hypothetical protein